MLGFLVGLICGGLIGCFMMALLQASGKENVDDTDSWTES